MKFLQEQNLFKAKQNMYVHKDFQRQHIFL